ncbi:MAG: CDP-archaeol synthase, partial [Verrucomicrobiota bacterium]
AGSFVFSLLGAFGTFFLFPSQLSLLNPFHVVVLGILLTIGAFLGDLAESVVKRSLGKKDSGNVLPGIGGALDLIDSILFTAPVLYFYLALLKFA